MKEFWLGLSGMWGLTGAMVISSRLLLNLYVANVCVPQVSDTAVLRSIFVFSFYPALLVLRYAQVALLVVLGVPGLLWFKRQRNDFLASCALSLTTIKPHLVYLIVLAVLLDHIQEVLRESLLGSCCHWQL